MEIYGLKIAVEIAPKKSFSPVFQHILIDDEKHIIVATDSFMLVENSYKEDILLNFKNRRILIKKEDLSKVKGKYLYSINYITEYLCSVLTDKGVYYVEYKGEDGFLKFPDYDKVFENDSPNAEGELGVTNITAKFFGLISKYNLLKTTIGKTMFSAELDRDEMTIKVFCRKAVI